MVQTSTWKCNILINPHAGLSVDWSVGLSIGLSVCHDFKKKEIRSHAPIGELGMISVYLSFSSLIIPDFYGNIFLLEPAQFKASATPLPPPPGYDHAYLHIKN